MSTQKAAERTDWLSARGKGTPKFVGDFFEAIAAQLMRGKQTKDSELPVLVDLEVPKAGAIVEVKASGCGLLRFRRSQFDAYQTFLDDNGHIFFDIMPFLVFFYAGRSWLSGKKGKSESVFKNCRDRLSYWRVLATQTTDAYLLDHTLLNRLPVRSLQGVFPDGAKEQAGSTVSKAEMLGLLKRYGRGLDLTLTRHRVTTRVKIGLVAHQMRFRFTTILSEQTRQQMGRVIPQLTVADSDSLIIRRLSLE